MKQYPVDKIRNIALLGHGGDGKTSLAEAMLYFTKAIDRMGKTADGNTVCDYDPEEIKRQISISASLAPVEWKEYKLNFIDTPGYFDFAGEVTQAMRVADTALIVVSAKNGVGVGTEKAWAYAQKAKVPSIFYVSKTDEENARFYNALNQLRDTFGLAVCPILVPLFEGDNMVGYVDLIDDRAFGFVNGKETAIQVPADMKDKVDDLLNMLRETVAETSEELMDKFFSGEPFTREEILGAIKGGVIDGSIAPVVCGSAYQQEGIDILLETIIDFAPAPSERPASVATIGGEETELPVAEDGPLAALVFKTVADPFVGKMSFFKVMSGVMKADTSVHNATTGQAEKVGKLYLLRGKKQIETAAIGAGDIGIITKLANTNTGDTLCATGKEIKLEGLEFPAPCLSLCVMPKSKGDEDKIASGLRRLEEEDRTITFTTNSETKQQILSGLGDVQLDVAVSKLKTKFGVSVDLVEPKVAYRETIRKKVKVQGRHKKQSGGHGQFGDVWIEFEPNLEQEDLVFAESVFGGSVPKNFFPAVEKGLRESVLHGTLAGYPVVYMKATLVDGSYHPVDSSEMSFKIAASLAFKAGMEQASPALLEPIGIMKVYVPDAIMGDIIGDLNKRRGKIMGMNPQGNGMQEVVAEVPMAEVHTYAIDLRSISQGRGSFSLAFERYDEAPANVAAKVIEESKAARAAEEE